MVGDCYDIDFTEPIENQIIELDEEALTVPVSSNSDCIHPSTVQFVMELCEYLQDNEIIHSNFEDLFDNYKTFIDDKINTYCCNNTEDTKLFYVSVLNMLNFLACDNGYESGTYVLNIMCLYVANTDAITILQS